MSVTDNRAQDEIQSLSDPQIEFLILADHAEAVGGKLYLMGGGWDRMLVSDFSQPQYISLAVGVLVPWNATNVRHTLQITIEDLDRRQPVDFDMRAGFVTGRPPTIEKGETQRTLLAVQRAPVRLKQAGSYQVVARIVDGHDCRVGFRLVEVPTVQIQRPSAVP